MQKQSIFSPMTIVYRFNDFTFSDKMAKSWAEIQKAYQERKNIGEEERYYQKERIRQMI